MTSSCAANTAATLSLSHAIPRQQETVRAFRDHRVAVLMVVLIFLVVSTTFKKRVPALNLNLPASLSAGSAITETDEPLTIQIRQEAPHLRLNNRTVTLSELSELLRERVKKNPQVNLNIQADEKAPFGEVVGVRDAASTAGITNIHAQVKLPVER